MSCRVRRLRTHARTHALALAHAHAYKHAHSRALGAGAPDEAGGRGNTPTAARAEDSSETLPPPPLTCTRTPCSTPPRPHLGPLLCWHPPATCAAPLHWRWLRVSWCCACTLFAPACRARRPRGSQAQQLQQSRTSWRRSVGQFVCVNVIMPSWHVAALPPTGSNTSCKGLVSCVCIRAHGLQPLQEVPSEPVV